MLHDLLKAVQTLHQLGNRLGRLGSYEEILQAAADAVASLLPADRVAFIEIDRDRHAVQAFVRGGPGREFIDTSVGFEELEAGLTGWVLREAKPALSPKNKPDDRESPAVRHRRTATNCGSIIVVPLLVEGAVLGTVTAINRLDQEDFRDEDVEVLVLFANYCAVVIGNGKLIWELRRQNEMKNTLFTILAHDLRGPVGNLAVILAAVLEQAEGLPEYRELLAEGERSARQTYNLLDNLLGWIRGEVEGPGAPRSVIPVRASIDNVRAWLHPRAVLKQVLLEIGDSPEYWVAGDPGTLETILRNLVSNAIKYSPAGTTVTLTVRRDAGRVVFEVSDRGCGIPAPSLGSLFGRRVDSVPGTDGEKGTGLGLMFCSDLARRWGGRLEADSVVGAGSRFRLILPEAAPSSG